MEKTFFCVFDLCWDSWLFTLSMWLLLRPLRPVGGCEEVGKCCEVVSTFFRFNLKCVTSRETRKMVSRSEWMHFPTSSRPDSDSGINIQLTAWVHICDFTSNSASFCNPPLTSRGISLCFASILSAFSPPTSIYFLFEIIFCFLSPWCWIENWKRALYEFRFFNSPSPFSAGVSHTSPPPYRINDSSISRRVAAKRAKKKRKGGKRAQIGSK